jgi:hypothetical protein
MQSLYFYAYISESSTYFLFRVPQCSFFVCVLHIPVNVWRKGHHTCIVSTFIMSSLIM